MKNNTIKLSGNMRVIDIDRTTGDCIPDSPAQAISALQHLATCKLDANWRDAVAILPELEAAFDRCAAALAALIEEQ